MKPQVSIIIPTLNEERHIARCLVSIQNQDFEDYEVIIVDNGSTDKTLHIINHFRKIRFFINDKLQGAGYAKNLGAKYAKGNILLFIDADEVIGDGYIAKLIAPILSGEDYATMPYHKNYGSMGNEYFRKGVFRAIKKNKFNNFDTYKGYGDDVSCIAVTQVDIPLYHPTIKTLGSQYFKGVWVGNSFHYTGRDTWLGKFLYKVGFFKGILERRYQNE
jgi:glycosyltransferase involved in cell wall biosynthesis